MNNENNSRKLTTDGQTGAKSLALRKPFLKSRNRTDVVHNEEEGEREKEA